jgi:ATP-dependent Clp protease ATP-binding subunit ClpA
VLELFTDRAREVVVQASDTARALGHEFVGAEHLLLGLIAERHGVAARTLQNLGVTEAAVRRELLARHPQDEAPADGMLPFTAEAKSVLELSLPESKRLGDSRIKTQHVLLALLKSEQQSGVELLEAIGLDAERVRLEIFRVLTERQSLLGEVHSSSFGTWETVGPDEHLRKLLIDAAELAVDCGRSTIEASDMVFAIAQDRGSIGLLLAELGVQVERVAELLERHRSMPAPPDLTGPN